MSTMLILVLPYIRTHFVEANFDLISETGSSGSGGGGGRPSPLPSPRVSSHQDHLDTDETGCLVRLNAHMHTHTHTHTLCYAVCV